MNLLTEGTLVLLVPLDLVLVLVEGAELRRLVQKFGDDSSAELDLARRVDYLGLVH